MIPTKDQIEVLWDTYSLPPYKRNHCRLVARLALWFTDRLRVSRPDIVIDRKRLEAAALLHDIDKSVPPHQGEQHPDTAVRILREGNMGEIADLVRTHSLHAILDQRIAPTTWEQKLLYLSDKMVKHTIISVDERFALWRSEYLLPQAVSVLDAAYPRVKELEKEVCATIGVNVGDVTRLASPAEMSTMELVGKGGMV